MSIDVVVPPRLCKSAFHLSPTHDSDPSASFDWPPPTQLSSPRGWIETSGR
jgi:hypothetical protein